MLKSRILWKVSKHNFPTSLNLKTIRGCSLKGVVYSLVRSRSGRSHTMFPAPNGDGDDSGPSVCDGDYLLTESLLSQLEMSSARMSHEAEGRMGYWLRGHDGERNNCFSKIQLVGQKYRGKTTLTSKTRFSRHCFGFQSRLFSPLVGYNIYPFSSSTNQNAALIIDHQLGFTNNYYLRSVKTAYIHFCGYFAPALRTNTKITLDKRDTTEFYHFLTEEITKIGQDTILVWKHVSENSMYANHTRRSLQQWSSAPHPLQGKYFIIPGLAPWKFVRVRDQHEKENIPKEDGSVFSKNNHGRGRNKREETLHWWRFLPLGQYKVGLYWSTS